MLREAEKSTSTIFKNDVPSWTGPDGDAERERERERETADAWVLTSGHDQSVCRVQYH